MLLNGITTFIATWAKLWFINVVSNTVNNNHLSIYIQYMTSRDSWFLLRMFIATFSGDTHLYKINCIQCFPFWNISIQVYKGVLPSPWFIWSCLYQLHIYMLSLIYSFMTLLTNQPNSFINLKLYSSNTLLCVLTFLLYISILSKFPY